MNPVHTPPAGTGPSETQGSLRPGVPRLLIVDDDEALREMLSRRLGREGLSVVAAGSGEEALDQIGRWEFDVALFDLHLPGMSGLVLLGQFKGLQPDAEVLVLTAHGSIETAIQAMKSGAYDYLTKPFQFSDLAIHIHKAWEKVRLARRQRQWLEQIGFESPRYRLIGSSPVMQRVVQLIEKVAPTDTTVLVCGPSGTGKELVARALHFNSPRRDRPLVTVNCAALQETLLESELFGHEKGAFTGAVQTKPGLMEVAEGGTLFIDEVGELSLSLQAKILRVLEDGHYRRVGGTQEMRANVRVIAASNRSLEEEQRLGRFREDLYYRLNVMALYLPPLRERLQDLPELVQHFLITRAVGPTHCRMHPEALQALIRYDWPGNIRELANVLERAQILAEDQVITLDHLPDNLVEIVPGCVPVQSRPHLLREVERLHVQEILRQEKGNKAQAAKALGISRRALYRLIAKYHLDHKEESEGGEP